MVHDMWLCKFGTGKTMNAKSGKIVDSFRQGYEML